MALACRLFGHKWDKCKCTRCGEIREVLDLHDWNGCVCRLCGKKRDRDHRYRNGTCVICGKKLTKKGLLEVFQPPAFSGFTVHELNEIDPAAQLKLAYETLPPEEADAVLIKAYDTVTRTYGNNPKVDEAVKQIFVPFMTEDRLLKLYQEDSVSMHHLTQHLDRDMILRACEQSGFQEREKKWFLTKCGIADGELVTSCDLGDHEYEYVETRWSEKTGTADSTDVSREYKVYRCKYCGHTYQEATGRSSDDRW